MSHKARSYSISDSFKETIHVPYINIEFEGWLNVALFVLVVCTGLFTTGFLLSILIGSNGWYLGLGIGVIWGMIFLHFKQHINNDIGANKLMFWYYTKIRNYKWIYTNTGNVCFMKKKTDGRMWIGIEK